MEQNELVNETLAAITAYRQKLDTFSYAGKVEEHVCELFDNGMHPDAVNQYEKFSLGLIECLAVNGEVRRAIMEKVGRNLYPELINMFSRLATFSKAMDRPNFRLMLLQESIEADASFYGEADLKKIMSSIEELTAISKNESLRNHIQWS
jgi:hypothetical protein